MFPLGDRGDEGHRGLKGQCSAVVETTVSEMCAFLLGICPFPQVMLDYLVYKGRQEKREPKDRWVRIRTSQLFDDISV